MRAVNLVPKDYRRGPLAGKGGEILSYVVIAGLAVVLAGVLAVVMTNNSISSKKSEIADLKQQEVDAKAEADSYTSYSTFASLQQARTATVSSLAQSRFDWERTLSEISEVIPSDVWLSTITGTVVPGITVQGGSEISVRAAVAGPALELTGCAPGQEEVAAFVAAIEDVGGVTRVGVQSSEKPENAVTAPAGGSSGECRLKDQDTRFELVVAFDAAPIPPTAAADGTTPTPLPAPTTPAPSTPGDGGVGQAQQQQASAGNNVDEAAAKSKKATKLIPGN